MKLSELIKSFRVTHHLSQDDFSSMSGLSKPYISMLENEKNTKTGKPIVPSIVTVQRIAKAMGMDLDSLLKKIDDDVTISISESNSPKSCLCPMACTEHEKELLKMYRCLPPPAQSAVDTMIRGQYDLVRPKLKKDEATS